MSGSLSGIWARQFLRDLQTDSTSAWQQTKMRDMGRDGTFWCTHVGRYFARLITAKKVGDEETSAEECAGFISSERGEAGSKEQEIRSMYPRSMLTR